MNKLVIFLMVSLCSYFSLTAQRQPNNGPINQNPKQMLLCDYEVLEIGYEAPDFGCSVYDISVEDYSEASYGYDPCETFCVQVTASHELPLSYYVSTVITIDDQTFEGYSNEFLNSTHWSAVICVGADSGQVFDIDEIDDVTIQIGIDNEYDLAVCGGTCTVMIGG